VQKLFADVKKNQTQQEGKKLNRIFASKVRILFSQHCAVRTVGGNMPTVKRHHHQLQHNMGRLELAGYVQSTWQTDVNMGLWPGVGATAKQH
jgi:hypothetical protein